MTRIELSGFSYVERSKINLGNALRFSLCIQIEFPNEQFGELGWEGNLAYFLSSGELKWMPPMNRVGNMKNRQYHWINPTLYYMVLDLLKAPQAEGGGANLLTKLNTPISVLLKKKLYASDVDPNLPKLLTSDI